MTKVYVATTHKFPSTDVVDVYETLDAAKDDMEKIYRRAGVRWDEPEYTESGEISELEGETHDNSYISGGGAPIFILIAEYKVKKAGK